MLIKMREAESKIDFGRNLTEVRGKIARAAAKVGRDPEEIKLVAVSKTHPVEVLRRAIAAGASVLGENKVQEAEEKIDEIGRDAAEWHLIGHLQSNKARRAVELFDVIHSLDSVKLARRLERICREENRARLSVLVQVDLADEETKSGVSKKDLPELIEYLKTCRHLRFEGLMILPPYFEDTEKVRPFFKELRRMRDELLEKKVFANGRGELSMGMSHDFEAAVEEGATIVRVGTAIFGERNYF
ncbi:MAG: YggS family pyridoxal phosphate-dependent enzyme [Pyrinomonadaceae bacterium]